MKALEKQETSQHSTISPLIFPVEECLKVGVTENILIDDILHHYDEMARNAGCMARENQMHPWLVGMAAA